MNADQFERIVKQTFGWSERQYYIIRMVFLGSCLLILLLLGSVALGFLIAAIF